MSYTRPNYCSVSLPIPQRYVYDIALIIEGSPSDREIEDAAYRAAKHMRGNGLGLDHVIGQPTRYSDGFSGKHVSAAHCDAVQRGILRAAQ